MKQEVFVNEARRAIEKCDAVMHAFEREVVESGVVDENELRLGRLEAKCKASRYLFKAASYAEFRGDCEAAMNALRECFERLIAFVDEVLPILLRGGSEQREENNLYRRRLWRVCGDAQSFDVLSIENVLDAVGPNFEDYGHERE